MPRYKITDHTTGKSYVIPAESPPTDAEVEEILAQVRGSEPTPASDTSSLDAELRDSLKTEGAVGDQTTRTANTVMDGEHFTDALDSVVKTPVEMVKGVVKDPKGSALGVLSGLEKTGRQAVKLGSRLSSPIELLSGVSSPEKLEEHRREYESALIGSDDEYEKRRTATPATEAWSDGTDFAIKLGLGAAMGGPFGTAGTTKGLLGGAAGKSLLGKGLAGLKHGALASGRGIVESTPWLVESALEGDTDELLPEAMMGAGAELGLMGLGLPLRGLTKGLGKRGLVSTLMKRGGYPRSKAEELAETVIKNHLESVKGLGGIKKNADEAITVHMGNMIPDDIPASEYLSEGAFNRRLRQMGHTEPATDRYLKTLADYRGADKATSLDIPQIEDALEAKGSGLNDILDNLPSGTSDKVKARVQKLLDELEKTEVTDITAPSISTKLLKSAADSPDPIEKQARKLVARALKEGLPLGTLPVTQVPRKALDKTASIIEPLAEVSSAAGVNTPPMVPLGSIPGLLSGRPGGTTVLGLLGKAADASFGKGRRASGLIKLGRGLDNLDSYLRGTGDVKDQLKWQSISREKPYKRTPETFGDMLKTNAGKKLDYGRHFKENIEKLKELGVQNVPLKLKKGWNQDPVLRSKLNDLSEAAVQNSWTQDEIEKRVIDLMHTHAVEKPPHRMLGGVMESERYKLSEDPSGPSRRRRTKGGGKNDKRPTD